MTKFDGFIMAITTKILMESVLLVLITIRNENNLYFINLFSSMYIE